VRTDPIIAQLAARQHGVVARRQLLAAGVSPSAIKVRVENRRLTPLHRGVYRLGETDTRLTQLAAAVLAGGAGAVLSHHAAAELHGFRGPRAGPIDVTVPADHARHRPGLRMHRGRVDAVKVHGIPVTTPARTILDLATELTARELRRAIEEAQIQRKLDPHSLTDAVDQAAGHRGARALRAAANHTHEPRLTRSEAERRLLDLIDRAGLPRPQTNVRVASWEVDAVWPAERLVVEVDGFAFHSTRDAFERDRRKETELAAAGYRVARVTWRQIAREREAVVASLARALSPPPGSWRPPAGAAPPGSPLGPPRW
jgi:very-short-patch-repair endonuclease